MAATTVLSFVVLAASGILTYALYNIYLHPLRHFPGPKLWSAFQWPMAYAASTGQLPYKVLAFHRKYGTTVRVGPNELAFADPQAWQDIYGLQPGRVQNRKNKLAYPAHDPESDDRGIIFGTDVGHAKARRALGPGFTPSAARGLGGMIERYADLLVRQLGKAVEEQEVQDVSEWFEWTTFDIMGDFAFGESFKCLETTTSHLFVRVLFEGHDLGIILGQLERYKVWTVMQKVLPKSFFKTLEELDALLTALTRKRQQQGHIAGRADIYNYLLENKSADPLTFEELKGNTWTLIFAGADTTATVLIFGSWALCKNPEVMKKVQAEVRGAFKDSSEINASSVNELKYMIAVLTEIMRMFPPGPSGLSRFITNPAGQSVAGHHVPHGTSCAIYQLSAFRLEANFTRPEEFIPERWLDDAPAEFANDRHDVYQPFSFGPRNCIGKPIAYVEMRILMAKWLYNFSFELADPDFDWLSTKKANSAWNNGGLKLRLRPVVNS